MKLAMHNATEVCNLPKDFPHLMINDFLRISWHMLYFWLVFLVLLGHASHAVYVVTMTFCHDGMERALLFSSWAVASCTMPIMQVRVENNDGTG